jgi:hypothetical protein
LSNILCNFRHTALTLSCAVALEQLIDPQLVKKVLAFNETPRFITVFTASPHQTLS